MTENQDGIFPVLAMRDIVVFPGVIVPLFIGRDKSIAALENALQTHKQILLVAQIDPQTDTPYTGDLYTIGTLANVLQRVNVIAENCIFHSSSIISTKFLGIFYLPLINTVREFPYIEFLQ